MPMPLTPPVDPVYYGQEFEAPDHTKRRDFFQYSQCTGRKKALCVCLTCSYLYMNFNVTLISVKIGINYRGQPHQLNGCISDAKRMRKFLIGMEHDEVLPRLWLIPLLEYYGYKEGDIVVLSDDGRTRREQPSRQNIIDAMHWLVKDARPHDSLVFHCNVSQIVLLRT